MLVNGFYGANSIDNIGRVSWEVCENSFITKLVKWNLLIDGSNNIRSTGTVISSEIVNDHNFFRRWKFHGNN